MAHRQVTIKDIARELGFSISTVSRALNDNWEVSRETRELVLQKARELNYHPNAQARGLVTQHSKMVGMVVPELFRSTFFARVAHSIQSVLLPQGYQLILTQSNESPEEERRLLQMLRSNNMDGLIVCTATDSGYNRDLFEDFVREGIALVFISRVCDAVKVPKIVVNDAQMAFRIVDHLCEEGCRRIAWLAGPEGIPSSKKRENGYRQALKAHDIPFQERYVIPSGLSVQDGMEAMARLLDGGLLPDAVFAFNDNVAFGAMKVLKERKIRIPEDVALAGFSDSLASTIVEPGLTSVAQPLHEMGTQAAACLLRQMEGFEPADKTIMLEGTVVIRPSSMRKQSISAI
jgi:DNA-binding LacI/PurR family transcriptional regulator